MIRTHLNKFKEALHFLFPSKAEKLAYEKKKQAVFNSNINKEFDKTLRYLHGFNKKVDSK